MSLLRKSAATIRRLYLSLGSAKACPICRWSGHKFLKRIRQHKPAPAYICPRCGSAERHRLSHVALSPHVERGLDSSLHFAPEACIEPWLRAHSKKYLSVDLSAPNVMQHMDITALTLEDNSYSFIWCSHVLEHIVDDRQAMQELFRVLQPGGLAVVMVPIYGENTYEDFTITSPEERLIHFKQKDHVRLYGLDIQDRLAAAGFDVNIVSTADLSPDDVSKYELEYPSTREVFLCSKPQ